MRKLIQRYIKGDAGGITTLFALSAPAIAGAVALGIDVGRSELAHKEALHAAEAAAVSAAVAFLNNNSTDLTQQGAAVAATYNFTAATNSTITVNRPPASGPNSNNPSAVEVIITQPQPTYFSRVLWPGVFDVTGRAVAVGGEKVCILALDPNASDIGVGEQGNAVANAQNCSVYSNSPSSSSVSTGGTATLSALSVNAVGSVYGQSNITTQDGIFSNQLPYQDPYRNLAMPSYTACSSNSNKTTHYSGAVVLYPGTYCGNISIDAGSTVTLASGGTYVFDQGSLSVAGGATLQGSGVLLAFTQNSGGMSVAGGANINLTPQTSGPYAGMIFYGDRAMQLPPSITYNKVTQFSLLGGANQVIDGSIYLPNANITYDGNSGGSYNCTQIIGYTISFAGNSSLGLNCPWNGVQYGGAPRILE